MEVAGMWSAKMNTPTSMAAVTASLGSISWKDRLRERGNSFLYFWGCGQVTSSYS
jgi:hypothetical protein